MNMESIKLSSSISYLMKYILSPLLLIALPFLCTLIVYSEIVDNNKSPILAVAVGIIILALFLLITIPYLLIKTVTLQKDGFCASGFFNTKIIPFSHITKVYGTPFLAPDLIILKLDSREKEKFIIFIPKQRLIPRFYKLNPAVRELRSLIDEHGKQSA